MGESVSMSGRASVAIAAERNPAFRRMVVALLMTFSTASWRPACGGVKRLGARLSYVGNSTTVLAGASAFWRVQSWAARIPAITAAIASASTTTRMMPTAVLASSVQTAAWLRAWRRGHHRWRWALWVVIHARPMARTIGWRWRAGQCELLKSRDLSAASRQNPGNELLAGKI